jgi:hypothetical protein
MAKRLRLSTLLTPLALLASCGAPLQHASDVASIFSVAPPSVGDLASSICANLAKRQVAPTTQGMSLQIGDCKTAGTSAVNYNDVTAFNFTDLPGASVASQANADVFSKSIQTQVWLNRQIPDLLPLAIQLMQKGGLKPGPVNLPDSATKAFTGLVTPVITITSAPQFNLNDMTFGANMNLTTSGVVAIAVDLVISGKIFNNGIAVTITTAKPDPPYSQSFLKAFEVVVLVIPYAKDIYVEMDVKMDIYNVGVNGVLDSKINSLFGSGLKTMLDAVVNVGS